MLPRFLQRCPALRRPHAPRTVLPWRRTTPPLRTFAAAASTDAEPPGARGEDTPRSGARGTSLAEASRRPGEIESLYARWEALESLDD